MRNQNEGFFTHFRGLQEKIFFSAFVGVRAETVCPVGMIEKFRSAEAKNFQNIESVWAQAKSLFFFQTVTGGAGFFAAVVNSYIEEVNMFALSGEKEMNQPIAKHGKALLSPRCISCWGA